jgi:hypothetical protein
MKLPKMNIPDSEKNEDWALKWMLAILTDYHTHQRFNNTRQKIYDNYQIVDGHFDPKQFEYVTKTYGLTAPARFVNYPMILTKLNLLAGELMSQPLQFTTHVINRDGKRRKNEKKVAIAAETLLRPIRREIEKALGTKLEDEELGTEIPPDVETFMKMSFRDHVEEFVNIGLQDLIKRHNLKHVFKRNFYDLNIALQEFGRVYIKNGFPYFERYDPRFMIYDYDFNEEDIEHGKFAGVDKYYTVNEILDRHPDMPKEKVDRLLKIEGMESTFFAEANTHGRFFVEEEGSGLKVREVYMQVRALRKMRFKVSENKFDPETPFYKMLSDDYKAKKDEKIVERFIDDIWECSLIGNEIIHGLRRLPNQIRYEENYAKTTLSIFGIRPNIFSGSGTSTVDALKNINFMYNIVMYHIDLAMARSGGVAVVYDVSQKPPGYTIPQIMHHAKNSGLILINSQQEGYQTNTFNQFQRVDFTLQNAITSLINFKMMLEDMADKLTGINAARAGINKSNDLVGVNERSVMQSSLITLPLFEAHYKFVGKVLNRMAALMKIAYAGEERMANLFGDAGMQYIEMDDSIALDEVSVYVENSGKEIQDKNNMHNVLNQAVASGQGDLSMIAKALRADSASEIERIITSGVTAVQEVAQRNEEMNQQLKQQANEINMQKIQIPLEVAKIKAQSDLEVARINAEAKLADTGQKLSHDADKVTAINEHSLDQEMLQSSNRQIENREKTKTPVKQPSNQ